MSPPPRNPLPRRFPSLACWLTAGLLLASPISVRPSAAQPSDNAAAMLQQVTFRPEATAEPVTVEGRVVVEDAAGGMLLEAPDGRQWVVEAADVISRRATNRPFEPLAHDQLAEQMLTELPAGFQVYQTTHYVVCYNTSRTYAVWTSSLLERLHRAFTNYWRGKGLELTEPEFPLVAVIYATADQYRAASRDELGGAAGSIVGYYSLTSNRVSMYDLTGAEALRAMRGQRGSLKQINQMLAHPSALPLVATIVHEATHQIAFNCGLQQRLADLPLWLVEGMAVYFEAPDLSSGRGWRGIGKINYPRLETFQANVRSQRSSRLLSLISDDKRFRDARTAADAYADAWALNYFLIRYRPDEYVAYVKALSEQQPLIPVSAEERVDQFREHFGDIGQLEREFFARMMRLD